MSNTTVDVTKSGQTVFRGPSGKFVSVKRVNRKNGNIRAGSLYDYKGTTVRAREAYNRGRRRVSIHDEFQGLVKDELLTTIGKSRVKLYVDNISNA